MQNKTNCVNTYKKKQIIRQNIFQNESNNNILFFINSLIPKMCR